MKKLIVRIKGGLGNQLFCYTAARRLALINDAELVIDDVTGFSRDSLYNRQYSLDHFTISARKARPSERMEPLERYRRYAIRRMSKFFPFEKRKYIEQEGVDFDPRLLGYSWKGTAYIDGLWQGEDYFKDVADTIRHDLRIKAPTDQANKETVNKIRNKSAIALHVRFFDDPNRNANNNAPNDYYTRAITEMERYVPDSHYFIFSDKPTEVRNRFPNLEDRFTLVTHNQDESLAYADLWLMTQCQHFIIANSTFSWWGAWLADNPNKKIIAPGFEMRQGNMWWGFRGLLPEEWIKL